MGQEWGPNGSTGTRAKCRLYRVPVNRLTQPEPAHAQAAFHC